MIAVREPYQQVLDDFDFERVHAVMTLLKWKWGEAVPTIEQLRKTAEELLSGLVECRGGEHWIATGGFEASVYQDEARVRHYVLVFQLAYAEYEEIWGR